MKDGANSKQETHMNIHHFEQLMITFQEHVNEDGSSGMDIDKFREVFTDILGAHATYDQMTLLFMKIDANSDGSVDWDEFSTYMMAASNEENSSVSIVFDDRIRRLLNSPHKDMIKRIDFIQKDRKYISVGRDGTICIWSQKFKLQKILSTQDFFSSASWVGDAVFMQDSRKLAITTDRRQICVFDVLSIKPRLVFCLSQLEHSPICMAYASKYDDEQDIILYGDDGGYVNVLYLQKKFFDSIDSEMEQLTPELLTKKNSLWKNKITFYRRKIHNDWVSKIQYISEINAFVSCSTEGARSLVIGDLERKTIRSVSVPRGIKCFEYCKRPSFLVTGGIEKVIQLWNPYVLSKPAANLVGHNSTILDIKVNNDEGHIISLSDDKVIKIWNARNLNCLQTLQDKNNYRPENIISAILVDQFNRQLITGSTKIEPWPSYKHLPRSHKGTEEASVIAAMYNINFHQVVSGSQNGSISIFDLGCGEKIFQFHNAHGEFELTAMCFDKTGRRLITGSRDGVAKMWNFNNGMILKTMLKESVSEITGVVYVEMGINKYIVVIDWDRKISIYIDDPDSFECTPSKILNGCGNSAHEGHADDLSTVAFCSPNILATGSIDGIIVLWNFETGYIKLTLKDPFLDLRSKEEKAIEKVIFLSKSNADYSDLGKNQWPRIALISSHADGFIRFWEIQTGGMLLEVNCQLLEDEGINTITIDGAATTLFVGGSKGHIAIYDVSEFNIDSKRDLKFACLNKNSWRAHVDSISSLSYVAESKVVISSSADSTIRVWTLEGVFIGAFGQDSTWILGDPSTFMPLPNDLLAEAHIAMERKIREKQQSENIKKNVIDTWLGIAVDMGETQITETSAEMNKRVAEMRARTVQILVIKKWQEYSERKRNSSNWEVPEELLTWKNKTSFFSLKNAILKKDKRPQTGKSNDHVYRMLTTHSLEEVPNLVGPHSGSGKQHIRIGDGRDAKAAARAIAESNRRSKKVVK